MSIFLFWIFLRNCKLNWRKWRENLLTCKSQSKLSKSSGFITITISWRCDDELTIRILESDNRELEKKVCSLQTENSELRAELNTLKQEIKLSKTKIGSLETNLESTRRDIAVLEQRLELNMLSLMSLNSVKNSSLLIKLPTRNNLYLTLLS